MTDMRQVTTGYIEILDEETFDEEILGFERVDMDFLQALVKTESKDGRQVLLAQNLDLLTLGLGRAMQWLTTQIVAEANSAMTAISALRIENIVFEISNLPLGNQNQNLEIVLAGYTALLTLYNKEDNPEKWAKVQNNLATAYWQRTYGDRAANIERAIAGYHAALEIRQPHLSPLDCLTTALNLGNLGYQESNWTLALQAYDNAIEAMKIAITWTISDKKRQEIQQNAIAIYKRARDSAFNLGRFEQAIDYAKDGQHFLDLITINGIYYNNIPVVVQAYLSNY